LVEIEEGVFSMLPLNEALLSEIISRLKQQGLWDYVNNRILDQHSDFNSGVFTPVYDYIFNYIVHPAFLAGQIDAGTNMWFSKAGLINANATQATDPSAAYVRGVTQYGLELRGKLDGWSQADINLPESYFECDRTGGYSANTCGGVRLRLPGAMRERLGLQ
jgi:hypothetical protein